MVNGNDLYGFSTYRNLVNRCSTEAVFGSEHNDKESRCMMEWCCPLSRNIGASVSFLPWIVVQGYIIVFLATCACVGFWNFQLCKTFYRYKNCGTNLQFPNTTTFWLLQPRLGLFEQPVKRQTAKTPKSRSQSNYQIALWYELEPPFGKTKVGEVI